MKAFTLFVSAFLLLSLALAAPAPAEVVGRITQVEGRVDFLKGGKLPASEAKSGDGVEVGDVLRTKSLSKAQITFIDNTVVTISPESRIAVDEYLYDASKEKRNAVLQLFQGMASTLVSKIFKVEEPDFILKTHTAVMGVRGTEVGIRLSANDSTFLNFVGLTRVANIFPEVSGDLFRKAAKVAFSFGSRGSVDLKDMQGTVVARGLPPTLPFTISEPDRQMFMRQLRGEFIQSSGAAKTPAGDAFGNVAFAGGGSGGSGTGVPSSYNPPGSLNLVASTVTNSPVIQPIIPPTILPPPPPPPPPGPVGPPHPPR